MTTAQQLIKMLSQFPPSTRVVIGAHDMGVNDMTICLPTKIVLNQSVASFWFGEHERLSECFDREEILAINKENIVDAVELIIHIDER